MTGILVVGSLNVDLAVYAERLPAPGETVTGREVVWSPGGKSANQAAAAARLGGSVSLLGIVGTDDHGRLLMDAATEAGVDTRWVRQRGGVATGLAVIEVDDAGENSIVVVPGANATLSPQDVAAAATAFERVGVVCLVLEVPIPTVLAAAQAARSAGALVILNASPLGDLPQELLRLTDVLLVNAHEAAALVPAATGLQHAGPSEVERWQAAGRHFAGCGITRTVVTLGGQGCVVLESDAEQVRVTAVPATQVRVVDTTGCGDAFTGALAVAMAGGRSLVDAAHQASRVAAIAATRRGAQSSYPSAAELA